ncbi:MAG: PilZ domain-containing protein [Acetivibrio sp.]
MEIEEMQVGDKVEILVDLPDKSVSLSSEIVEVLEGNRILISQIVHEGKSVGFPEKVPVFFIHLAPKLHRWDNPSVKLVKYHSEIYHCVTLSGEGASYNRRESFRLYLGVECPLFFATAKGTLNRDVLLKDISTGGLSFILPNTEDPLPLNKKIRLHLKDDSFDKDLRAEIIRIVPLEDKNASLYGCRFLLPDASIGRYIMLKEGQKRKGTHSPNQLS